MSDPAKTRILVTGGTGFIGRYVVALLVSDGFRPVVTTSNETAIAESPVDVVEVDLTNAEETNELVVSYKPQIVLHLAGVTGNDDPTGKIYDDVNLNGTINLLRSLEKVGVDRVILLGSAAEYGNHAIPFREDMLSRPVSHYAVSKANANRFALDMFAAIGFPVTVLRVFTAYGKGQPDKMFLSQLIKHALLKRHFKMSDGLQKRDFVHVEDVAEAIKASMTAKNSVGRIINIGSGKGIVLRDLARHVWKMCDADSTLLDIGSRDKTGDDSFDTEADISMAAEILDWHPGPAIISQSDTRTALNGMITMMRASLVSANR